MKKAIRKASRKVFQCDGEQRDLPAFVVVDEESSKNTSKHAYTVDKKPKDERKKKRR